MAKEQLGICAEANIHGLYMLFNANDGREAFIRSVLAELPNLFESFSERFSEAMLTGVVAIGASYWDELYPDARPALLRPFPYIAHEIHEMPTEPIDLFIQVRSDRLDVNHLIGQQIMALFANSVELVEQCKGFRYLDGRDLFGFIHGSGNPKGPNKHKVALVGDEDIEFSAGSYVHIQRYRHQLRRWDNLDVLEQEKIIGRTKMRDQSFAQAKKASNSHTKITRLLDEQGRPRQILRHAMPYGHLKLQGQFFVCFCKTPEHFESILMAMVKGDEHGRSDGLLDYTQAELGAAFFAPSITFLRKYQ